MPLTLLTGANSFVSAHIINSLIDAGHSLIGTVRRAKAGEEVLALHPEWKEKLEIIVVDNYEAEENWDVVFKKYSFDHIVHVAAPLLDNPAYTDYDRDFLKPSVDGNLALLRSAYKNAPTLKSVVVTGSVNALTTGSPDELRKGELTNDSWLPLTQEDARAAQNAYLSYCSGKKEGELAIWDFVKNTSPAPTFSVTVLLPALIFGPPLQPIHGGLKGLNYSSSVVYGLMNGSNETVPPTTFPSYIDVRDLAEAHVKSLTTPAAANKRLLVGGAAMTYTDLVHALAKVPELAGRIPADSDEAKSVVLAQLAAEEGNKALGLKFTSLDQTMADMAKSFLAMEKAEK